MSLPRLAFAPAVTRATRCGALTGRQRAWADSISLNTFARLGSDAVPELVQRDAVIAGRPVNDLAAAEVHERGVGVFPRWWCPGNPTHHDNGAVVLVVGDGPKVSRTTRRRSSNGPRASVGVQQLWRTPLDEGTCHCRRNSYQIGAIHRREIRDGCRGIDVVSLYRNRVMKDAVRSGLG